MKLIRPFVSGLVACGLVLGMVSSLAAQEQGTGKVVNIRGSARYMTADNQTWRPLKTGTMLRPGAVIQTASDSYVDVVFNNPKASGAVSTSLSAASATITPVSTASAQPRVEQDAIRVFENSVLGIDRLSVTQTGADRVTDTSLDLKAGRILGTVKRMSAASQYEVKIPNGVAGIRGTIYTISADGVLSVLSGSVVLAFVGSDGTPVTQEVREGQQYDARTGQITPIPTALLQDWLRVSRQLGLGTAGMAPTTFTVDRTIYFVSPTLSENDNGFFNEMASSRSSASYNFSGVGISVGGSN